MKTAAQLKQMFPYASKDFIERNSSCRGKSDSELSKDLKLSDDLSEAVEDIIVPSRNAYLLGVPKSFKSLAVMVKDFYKEKETSILPEHFVVYGKAIAKPRQTRSDKWKKRPCVMRYREWADNVINKCKLKSQDIASLECHFYIKMPDSWSLKKKLKFNQKSHRVKPDIDNLWKGVCDALCKSDQVIHRMAGSKTWVSCEPETVIKIEYNSLNV